MSTPSVRTLSVHIRGLAKSFTLHHQGGATLRVLEDFDMDVVPGECVALHGPSGTGKSTVLKCLYANYHASAGFIGVQHRGATLDMASCSPREVLEVRRDTMGYVSQFLRVIPRVPAARIVADELLDGYDADPAHEAAALATARALLARLNVSAQLATLPPATFSGGEQQRVNIARGFVRSRPIMLLDEPTASLDPDNRAVVVQLIREACARGAAIIGIFHDDVVRASVATRVVELRGSVR
jgi:alpha-D-ribose 1-methylphosphonate 5-triphosphate synthase subunit PhnL